MTEDAICFDGSIESAKQIADALAPRSVEREMHNGRPRLVLEGKGAVAAVYVYPGEFVSTKTE